MTKDEEKWVLEVIKELEMFLKKVNKPIDCIAPPLPLDVVIMPGRIGVYEKAK